MLVAHRSALCMISEMVFAHYERCRGGWNKQQTCIQRRKLHHGIYPLSADNTGNILTELFSILLHL